MEVLLEAKNIKKSFDGVPALIDGNLVCRRGKILGLLGANGSGKSTINKCITGVYLKNGGNIIFEGTEINFKSPMEAKKAGISMAFQNLSLLPDLSVWQNIVMGFEPNGKVFLDNKTARSISKQLIEKFFGHFNIDRLVRDLNPSEMQIVEIVKAMSVNPKVLILDEPTAALEQSHVKILFEQMKEFVKEGRSIIFTSHRMWEVMEICDEVVIFKNGLNTGYLDFEVDEKNENLIIQKISGRDISVDEKRKGCCDGSEFLLRAKNLTYGSILNKVSFGIKKGEVVGIGGLSGQGQEELLLAIAGYYHMLEGDIFLNGELKKFSLPSKAIENGIVLVPGDRQTQGLMMNKSIFENNVLPRAGLKKEPFFTPIKRYKEECKQAQITLKTKYSDIDEAVSNLSGGNAQKVVLSKWIHIGMSLLILSDPAKGVDVGAKEDMYKFVQENVEREGLSVLLYASDNEELINNCDRVYIMHEGCIVGELRGEEITDENIVRLSMLGKQVLQE